MFWDEETTKRTLGTRDRKILWERAHHKCEACGKVLDYTEMQVGHKIPASKGGKANLKNSVCLCWRCNNNQGTDTWNVFLKKMEKQPEISEKVKVKEILKGLSIQKLKFLAQKYNLKVKGRTEESLWGDSRKPPSKTQYVNALAKQISVNDIDSGLKEIPHKERKIRKKRKQSSSWF
jgi:hypothetical protein